jgi:NAD(P)H-hydrate repair Nnr-like enzyme with NAD(P)H-hydrate dehydratase domain
MMTEPLPETPEGTLSLEALPRLQELIEGKDCLAIGPGLSRNPQTAKLVRRLVVETGVPIVLDADGLNAFESHTDELNGEATREGISFPRTLVLTPHPGEMSRLLGGVATRQIQSDRLKIATEFAQQHNVIVVLKGHRTIIASPYPPSHINVTGNPGMAKGGSGDVLTGIVAALLARQSGNIIWISQDDPSSEGKEILAMMKEFLATRDPKLGEVLHKKMAPKRREEILKLNSLYVSAAVCLHGLAADIACDVYGEYAMTATQIIESLGEAIALCRQQSSAGPVYLQR